MVGRNLFRSCFVVVALLGARSATADVINFTGNVTTDFSSVTNPNATIYNNPTAYSSIVAPGIFIKDVALDYNATTDKMYVGIQTYGVAGNVSAASTIGTGNGMAVGFAPLVGTLNLSALPAPVFVAGDSNVAVGASTMLSGRSGTGLDGFNVSTYTGGTVPGTMNLLTGFGPTLTAGTGTLAFNPSTSTPDYEFTITNFSKLLGSDPSNKVVVMVQDGQVNAGSGKSEVPLIFTIPVQEPQELPEPAAVLVWTCLAGGMAWAEYRRRMQRSLS